MICGCFNENKNGCIDLHDVDGKEFEFILNIWCGNEEDGGKGLTISDMLQLGTVADRFQVTEVAVALEETVIRELSVEDCAEVLAWSGRIGLRQAEWASHQLAVDRFEEVVATASFVKIDEDALCGLLDDDGLVVKNEETVWEALLVWMRAEGPLRGRELLRKIRFPLMDEAYLASTVPAALPAEHADWIEGLVAEALRARAARQAGAAFHWRLLGPRALVRRRGLGVRWEDYADGGERRLEGHTEGVSAVVECAGRLCSASWDGSIRVWNGATLAHEACLRAPGAHGVDTLAAWEGRLVSGHADGALRVWDVAGGACARVIRLCGGRFHAVPTELLSIPHRCPPPGPTLWDTRGMRKGVTPKLWTTPRGLRPQFPGGSTSGGATAWARTVAAPRCGRGRCTPCSVPTRTPDAGGPARP